MNGEETGLSILTVDQGNSFVKAVVWKNGEPVASLRSQSGSIEEFLPLLEEHVPDGCAYCSVCHTDAKFLETLRLLVGGNLLVLTPATRLPIEVRYGSRATLGSDRVAAAAGAAALFPGETLLVVDAGTAITIDVLQKGDVFLGGNIAPGMRMRFSSLHEHTRQLPLVEAEGVIPEFGNDTVTAIRAGVVGGMTSEIADAFSRAALLYGCSRVVLTGRDGEVFQPMLRARGIDAVSCPDLVGRGLASIYLCNGTPDESGYPD